MTKRLTRVCHLLSFQESLKKASKDPQVLIRPASWQGNGYAFKVIKGNTYLVPSISPLVPAMTKKVSELLEDWETLTLARINWERDADYD